MRKNSKKIMFKQQRSSIASRGAWAHFVISIALISIIPALTILMLLTVGRLYPAVFTPTIRTVISAVAAGLAIFGYFLLAKYPYTILTLKNHLRTMAEGQYPDKIQLIGQESDIEVIEKYLNLLVFQTQAKIAIIEQQREIVLHAERNRVMIESLGAACHHLGQPTCMLTSYLDMINVAETDPEKKKLLNECVAAAGEIADILHKLQQITTYRTEDYLKNGNATGKAYEQKILTIPEDGKA